MPVGRLVREQLVKAGAEGGTQRFLRHTGELTGPKSLSSRKGFSLR